MVTALAWWVCPGCGTRRKDAITIAAIGPLSGAQANRGKDLRQAVEMATAEANAAGGVNGHPIEVRVYDDADQPGRARELAHQVAGTSALAVLGQVASSAGIAAGEVYQKEHILAITGAASQSSITHNNDWFYRLLPDAAGQGRFLADYARYVLEAQTLAVIREKGTAGEEFASALRDRAKKERMRIAADVEFVPAEAKDAGRMTEIARKLKPLRKGEIVVLGTQYAETAAMLRALREALGPFVSLGYSSVATEALSGQFPDAGQHVPGYYTDGLIVAAPQLPDIAEYAQTSFGSRFQARYGTEPSPEAVRWYEGAKLLFQAMTATGVSGADRTADRERIRDWIATRNRPEAAVAGVGGPIYFDQDHNVRRGISVGAFYRGHMISAPVQLIAVSDPAQVPGWDRLVGNGMVIDAGGSKMVKTPVVYAGIDLNSLDNIDVRANSFAADFFLWFRHQDALNLDPHEVELPGAISGGQLGQEILRRSRGGFTTETYHVKGVFRADYEFSRFPFDRQVLQIPVQFRNSSSYSLILAYGENASADPPEGSARRQEGEGPARSLLSTTKLWRLTDQIFYRDVVALESSSGEQDSATQPTGVQFNRINAEITIQRNVLGFAVKNFLPLACILIAVLVGYALAADVINPRVSIGVTALLTTSVLYQKMASDLPTVTYIIAIDYVFFAFFGFCVAFLGLTVVTYETHKAKRLGQTLMLNRLGAALTLMVLTGTLLFVWMRYWAHV